jgi:hypothetical protein
MEIIAICALVTLVFVIFFWWQTKTKGRWGLGMFTGTQCPRCATRLPMFRKPGSPEEIMWGGWTCPNCGCKVDKYGNERAAS